MKGGDDEKSFNRVPLWNGRPEDFHHYIQEVKWFSAATKTADRPYAAARLIRRMLDSDYVALKSLVYKLDPTDYKDEHGIDRLVRFLESSPLNKQPIPDAGSKLNQYYRKLNRRSGESIPQFLVREDISHDSMWRALQRLLREKALDFSKYEVSEAELRRFCGMGPEDSLYFGDDLEAEDDEDRASRTSHRSGASRASNRSGGTTFVDGGNPFTESDPSNRKGSASGDSAPRKGQDLIERLMAKGLIPLAALDIIRGWMVLEATSTSDLEKSLIKAATQNRLGYEAIRAALLTMHEDRDRHGSSHVPKGRGRSFQVNWTQDYDDYADQHGHDGSQDQFQSEMWHPPESWEDGFYGYEGNENDWHEEGFEPEAQWNEPMDSTTSVGPEEEAMIAQLQEEEKGLSAMWVDNQRNLQQAREAVAASKRDRGWQGSSQGGKSKSTTTFAKGKGKGKPKGKSNFPSSNPTQSNVMWASPKGFSKGKSNFSKGGRFHGSHSKNGWYTESFESGMLSLETEEDTAIEGEINMAMPGPSKASHHSSGAATSTTEAGGTRGVVDTGATVTAGGHEAVQSLITGLAKVRPDLKVTLFEGDRPYFRYGSGRWGRALFKAQLEFGNVKFSVYSLPSEKVPVLVGMRELGEMDVILHCRTSRAIVSGTPRQLEVNSKGHALFNFAEDIPMISQTGVRKQVRFDESQQSHIHVGMLEYIDISEKFGEYSEDENFDIHGLWQVQDETLMDDALLQHLGISSEQMQFLLQPSFSVNPGDSSSYSHLSQSPSRSSDGIGKRAERDDQRCHSRDPGRGESKGRLKSTFGERLKEQDQHSSRKATQNPVRRVSHHESDESWRSKSQGDDVAVLRSTCDEGWQQPLGAVDGVHLLRSEDRVHPSDWSTGHNMQARSCSKRGPGHRTPPQPELREEGSRTQHLQASYEVGSGSACVGGSQDESSCGFKQGQDGNRTVGGPLGRFVRTDRDCREGWQEGSEEVAEWMELHQCKLGSDERSKLLSSSQEHWAVFDATRALRDLREASEPEHVWEICCSPTSTLSEEVKKQGFKATRLNWESGFDLGNAQKVEQAIQSIPVSKPTRMWGSPKCTAVSSIQNINQRTEEQRKDLLRKRMRTRREVRHLIRMFKAAFARNPKGVHLYMEWPKSTTYGWNLWEWQELQNWLMSRYQQPMYWTEIHGCMVGLKDRDGMAINKPWYVLTTDYDFYVSATVKCDGGHKHRQIVGMGTKAVHDTAFYPQPMVHRIVQIWKKQWYHDRHSALVQQAFVLHTTDQKLLEEQQACQDLCHQFAFPAQHEKDNEQESSTLQEEETVTSEVRERARAMLHRLHRAVGHPGNQNLARLCRDRKLPSWVVQEAKNLKCPTCVETQRGV